MKARIEDILKLSPVVPVLVIRRVEDAVAVARALVAGGLRVLELTLRTDVAWQALEAIIGEVEDAVVGVGTVTRPAELERAQRLGARFAISPGFTSDLLSCAASALEIPYVPGVATVSEAMTTYEAGFSHLKLFPASIVGGVAWLKAIAGPLPDLRFCPTGGITESTAPEYLALPNVLCVGGSWLAPDARVVAQDWAGIAELARRAAALGALRSWA